MNPMSTYYRGEPQPLSSTISRRRLLQLGGIGMLSLGVPGRQHWLACYSAILAGGSIRGGMVYGASDKTRATVKDKPVRPQGLSATSFHALGVPFAAPVTKDGVS